jgi:photosynthetic reaction center H subunit
VIGGDGDVAGHVCDVWVDRAEALPRYLEVSLPDGRRVLTPIPFARIRRTEVVVNSILSTQFGGVPPLRHADQITLLEEEKVAAYYGAGTLFATPHRQEPIF